MILSIDKIMKNVNALFLYVMNYTLWKTNNTYDSFLEKWFETYVNLRGL